MIGPVDRGKEEGSVQESENDSPRQIDSNRLGSADDSSSSTCRSIPPSMLHDPQEMLSTVAEEISTQQVWKKLEAIQYQIPPPWSSQLIVLFLFSIK